jgi:hypothetical protein
MEVGGSDEEDEDGASSEDHSSEGEHKAKEDGHQSNNNNGDKGAAGTVVPAMKSEKAQGSKEEEEEEGDDSDSEGADDAEMFKMDAKLAAYMRAVADKRASAREMKAALAALKFRALSLLEVYARKVGGGRVGAPMIMCAHLSRTPFSGFEALIEAPLGLLM